MAETTNQTVSSEYDDLKLENQLCFPLYAASREVVKQYTPYLKPLGLTYTQYITLMVLWQEKKLRVGDLGHKLFLDTGTLTPLLKKMEEAKDADCVIVAVAHNEFKAMSLDDIKRLYRDCDDSEKVLIDVKGLYKITDLNASGMKWWRL